MQSNPYQYQQSQQQQQQAPPSPYHQGPGNFPQQTPPPGHPYYPHYQHFPQQPNQQFTPQQQQHFAQWAYQQMLFQQSQLAYQPHGPIPQMNPYMNSPYQQHMQPQQHGHQPAPFIPNMQPQPPYARDRNGSRTSVNSTSSRSTNGAHSGNRNHPRTRTTSNASASGNTSSMRINTNGPSRSNSPRIQSPSSSSNHHQRVSSTGSQGASPAQAALQAVASRAHASTASAKSSSPSPPLSSSGQQSASGNKPNGSRLPPKPSPLSQSSGSRRSQDEPEARTPTREDGGHPAPTPAMLKSGGLKGRLRRALSLSTMNTLEGASGDSGRPEEKLGSRRQVVAAKLSSEGQIPVRAAAPRTSTDSAATLRIEQPGSSTATDENTKVPTEGSIRSTATNTTQMKKKKSLFNAKFNRSTDNISLSSTVSSASMMIRKLGSVGKLVRRNSLMGISNMFKDKKKAESDTEEAPTTSKGKKAKSSKAEASVSHATAEVDREAFGDDMAGLTPAAKLARQHTLRSNAEEAARRKAEREAKEKQQQEEREAGPSRIPFTWQKSTTSNKGEQPDGSPGSNEFGEPAGIEEESSEEEVGDQNGAVSGQDDEGFDSDEYPDYEDDTVRVEDGTDDYYEPWAVGFRRSIERTLMPTKGILKHANNYNQLDYLTDLPPPQLPHSRLRSNSYDSAPSSSQEPGPLARIPSPDPDHIDGLHRTNSASSRDGRHGKAAGTAKDQLAFEGLPPLDFGAGDSMFNEDSKDSDEPRTSIDKANFPYLQPNLNVSAPALAPAASAGPADHPVPANSHPIRRNGPAKKCSFAPNLSVYHTFAATIYDRSCAITTSNRLTPFTANMIKEELNTYKMEEMEVHAASRRNTHFFA